MNTLSDIDLHRVVSFIPLAVRSVMKKDNLYLGGGFIRELISQGPQGVQDIDLFGTVVNLTDGAVDLELDELFTRKMPVRKIVTKNATTLLPAVGRPVQFISRWPFKAPKDVAESFDFTVCQAVVFWDESIQKWGSIVNESFYPDLAARRLVYTSPVRIEEAGGSLMRVVKFLKRGYSISPVELGRVVARLVSAHHHMKGVDEVDAARVFSGLLLEVDPLSVVAGLDYEPLPVGAAE